MKTAVFSCEGSELPHEWTELPDAIFRALMTEGDDANVDFRIESLTGAALANLGNRGLDLVRIAAFAFAADQEISRGGEHDAFLADWQRQMFMVVPVSDPDFWGAEPIRRTIERVLNYVADEYWALAFSQGDGRVRQGDLIDRGSSQAEGDTVIMLSGGMDSLAAALVACDREGAHPILVSHRPSPVVAAHQEAVATGLRQRFPAWTFPQLSPWINRRHRDPAETTQRTRSFLFAAIGAAVAAQRSIREVLLSDNGVVSVNIPINQQLVGARASRSTHPKFIWLFNQMLTAVWGQGAPVVRNSLFGSTREEVVRTIAEIGGPRLLRETVSCSSPYRRAAEVQHCGVCSQCVGRRFATLAAGMEPYDPVGGYEVDIFADSLDEGLDLTVPTSFVRFAQEVLDSDGQAYWMEHAEFADCILPDDPNTARTAGQLIATLQRHSRGVIRVMEGEVEKHKSEIASGHLPRTCLLSLVAEGRPSGRQAAAEPAEFVPSDNYRTIWFRGSRRQLTEVQANLVKELHRRHGLGEPEVLSSVLRAALGVSEEARIREWFLTRNSDLYCKGDSLIMHGLRKGTYRLNLPDEPPIS